MLDRLQTPSLKKQHLAPVVSSFMQRVGEGSTQFGHHLTNVGQIANPLFKKKSSLLLYRTTSKLKAIVLLSPLAFKNSSKKKETELRLLEGGCGYAYPTTRFEPPYSLMKNNLILPMLGLLFIFVVRK
jgi:hypothetical protein